MLVLFLFFDISENSIIKFNCNILLQDTQNYQLVIKHQFEKISQKSSSDVKQFLQNLREKGYEREDYRKNSNNFIHFAEKIVTFLINEPISGRLMRALESSDEQVDSKMMQKRLDRDEL